MKNSIKKNLFLLFFLLVPPAECKELKIGLVTTNKEITINSSGKASLVNLFTGKEISKTKRYEYYSIVNKEGLLSTINKSTNLKLGAFTGPIELIPEDKNNLVCCNKTCYRGALIITTNNNKNDITVINSVDLEDYLLSVVPSEIPSTWNIEVLKAQSIAARSYALGYLGRRREKGYDLESTVEDQVYLGVLREKRITSEAVKETKGEILVDEENKPLIALYHSSGGGYTDSIENLWDEKPSKHIQPRPDYDDNSPHFKWFRNYTKSEINKYLSSLNIGEIKNLTVLSRSISGRVTYLKIIGTLSDVTLRGEEFRKYLKLPSSKFNFIINNEEVRFAGRGLGHGLGLSQWGAKELAENGFSYKEILAHYYPGAMIIKTTNEE